MKKQTIIIAMLTILSFLLVTWLPCQADDVLCGCAKIKKGTLRIIDCSSQCLKSEYPVTISGTASQNQNPLPNFKGELCWQITKETEIILLQFYVSHLGSGHYILSGKLYEDGILRNILHGNAELENSNILMTIVNSGKDRKSMYVGISHVTLDSSTLNGEVSNIGHDRDYTEIPLEIGDIYIDSDTQYSSDIITNIQCH